MSITRSTILYISVAAGLLLSAASCGKKEERAQMPEPTHEVNKNLLRNGSFEERGGAIPRHWTMTPFSGADLSPTNVYGLDEEIAKDGEKSLFIEGHRLTKRWMSCSQEVRIDPRLRLQVSGFIRTSGAHVRINQTDYNCNLGLFFFDSEGRLIETGRLSYARTQPLRGSKPWTKVHKIVEPPANAAFVRVGCIFKGIGKAWFDDLSLVQLEAIEWVVVKKGPIEFRSLDSFPMEEADIDYVYELFKSYEKRLNQSYSGKILYYLYPDQDTMEEISGKRGITKVDWEKAELHTILPREEHDIVHLITEPWGRPPTLFVEGIAIYAQNGFEGQPLHELAREMHKERKLYKILELANENFLDLHDYTETWPILGSFITYLIEVYGMDKMEELYRAMHAVPGPDEFQKRFQRVMGSSVEDVEARWRKYLGQSAG